MPTIESSIVSAFLFDYFIIIVISSLTNFGKTFKVIKLDKLLNFGIFFNKCNATHNADGFEKNEYNQFNN